MTWCGSVRDVPWRSTSTKSLCARYQGRHSGRRGSAVRRKLLVISLIFTRPWAASVGPACGKEYLINLIDLYIHSLCYNSIFPLFHKSGHFLASMHRGDGWEHSHVHLDLRKRGLDGRSSPGISEDGMDSRNCRL